MRIIEYIKKKFERKKANITEKELDRETRRALRYTDFKQGDKYYDEFCKRFREYYILGLDREANGDYSFCDNFHLSVDCAKEAAKNPKWHDFKYGCLALSGIFVPIGFLLFLVSIDFFAIGVAIFGVGFVYSAMVFGKD